MSENKMCNHCNKFTADEIVKGDVFCIECGHQRGTSPQQEQANKAREGKEKRKIGSKCTGAIAMHFGFSIENNNNNK